MSRAHAKRLCFVSRYDLSSAPYGEIILPALQRDRWEIDLFAPGASNSVLQHVNPYKCKQHNLNAAPGGLGRLRHEIELLKILLYSRFKNYDVICVHSQSLSARAALAFIGPKFGKKLAYYNPELYDPFDHPLYYRLERALCRKVDLYLNCEFHRAYISQAAYGMKCPALIAPPNLPSCWPVPARSDDLRSQICNGKADQFVLMLHGCFHEKRMVPQLFKALALLPHHFRLVMTGMEHRKDMVDRLLLKLKIEDRVTRLPHLGFLNLFKYSVNADAGVLLYLNNDLGNFFTSPGRLTEYLVCGLPVVATNHTGLENLVLRYGLGESVDSTRPERIAEGILRLEQGMRQGLYTRRLLRQKFLESFAFDHWEPAIAEAFNNLLCSKRKQKFSRPRFPWLSDSSGPARLGTDWTE